MVCVMMASLAMIIEHTTMFKAGIRLGDRRYFDPAHRVANR